MLGSQTRPAATSSPRQQRSSGLTFLLNNGLLIALVIEVIIFSLLSPDLFLSAGNFITILRISATTGITVAFVAVALIAGQIDLSTAQVGAATAIVFAWLFAVLQWSLEVSFLLAVLFAVVVGLVNAWLVTRLRIPSLVGTLAVGTFCYGIAFSIVEANGTGGLIRLNRPPLRDIVTAEVLGIPATVIVMFVIYALLYLVLTHTKLGAHLYALGGNTTAARLNGIRANRFIRIVLVGTAVSAGISAIILSGRSLSAGMAGITGGALGGPLVAAVFSGVGLSGGVGRIERTLIGVVFLAVLTSGMAILNVTPFARAMIEGLAFALAIVFDSIRQRMESR